MPKLPHSMNFMKTTISGGNGIHFKNSPLQPLEKPVLIFLCDHNAMPVF
jgi:hypothetical protein